MIFYHREDAARQLAKKLSSVPKDSVVLGLARGGVVIAATIAKELGLFFDVMVVRKIPAPGNEELAIGALADVGEPLFNEEIVSMLGVSKEYLQKEIETQRQLVRERKKKYLAGRSPPNLEGKTVVLVDDGIATGATMHVAIQAVKQKNPAKIFLAVPVASVEAFQKLSKEVDEAICLDIPKIFYAVGAFYKEFNQVSDQEVVDLLKKNS